jgi:hypothetical protein
MDLMATTRELLEYFHSVFWYIEHIELATISKGNLENDSLAKEI